MDIALRRLRAEDVSQVTEIEREAFAPLGIGTPFKRELNNRYARYLVAYRLMPPYGGEWSGACRGWLGGMEVPSQGPT